MKLAGGEGAYTFLMAKQMMDLAGLSFIQIDAGRIGGISVARRVAEAAQAAGVTYVNHTFTSHLALSASLQPYAASAPGAICEYPVEPRQLALDITRSHLVPDADGFIHLPEGPGLGIEVAVERLAPYLVDVVIEVRGRTLYRTPALTA